MFMFTLCNFFTIFPMRTLSSSNKSQFHTNIKIFLSFKWIFSKFGMLVLLSYIILWSTMKKIVIHFEEGCYFEIKFLPLITWLFLIIKNYRFLIHQKPNFHSQNFISFYHVLYINECLKKYLYTTFFFGVEVIFILSNI